MKKHKKENIQNITKESLFEKYVNERKTFQEIAKEYKCGTTTICRLLKEFNIPKTLHYPKNTFLVKEINRIISVFGLKLLEKNENKRLRTHHKSTKNNSKYHNRIYAKTFGKTRL